MDAYRPDPEIEKLLKLVLPSLNKGFKEALEYALARAKYFVSFEDFTRILLYKLEEKMVLPDVVKGKLWEELEKIYNNAVQETVLEIAQAGKFIDFRMPDSRSVEYALRLHDFYLGKFFQGDKQLRKRVLNWMSEYYLQEGNPIGKGQKGIKEFLKHFKNYIQPQTEWKARQIIDTSVNFLRNAGKIRTLQHARVEYYRWDATSDRLTCKICRALDGRIFKTAEAVRVLDMLETTQDPELIRGLRPFITTVLPPDANPITKMPPAHPHCFPEDVEVFTNEGFKQINSLTGEELFFSFNPDNPTEFGFVPAVHIFKYHYKGKLVRFTNRQLDIAVTPDHSMLTYSRGGKKRKKKGYHFYTAEKLPRDYSIPLSPIVYSGGVKKIQFGGITLPSTLFARLMGYYLSEGSTSVNPEGRYVIKIAQSNQEKKIRIAMELKELEEHGFKVWVGKDAIYLKSPNSEFAQSLQLLGKSNTKHLPPELFKCSPEDLRIFINCYVYGDGTVKKGKHWKGAQFNDSITAFTSSKKLADFFALVCLLAGYSVSYYVQRTAGKTCEFKNGTYTINTDIYRINIKRSRYVWNYRKSYMDYDGLVYGIELQKWHTLFVRYRGKTCWTGNCRCRVVAHFEISA